MSWLSNLSKNHIGADFPVDISQRISTFSSSSNNSTESMNVRRSPNTEDDLCRSTINQTPLVENDKDDLSLLKLAVSKLESHVKDLAASNTAYKAQIIELRSEVNDLWYDIESTQKDLHQFMQYNRRENIEIVGIPKNIPDNQIETLVLNVLGSIGVNVSHYDIAGCHRLKNRRTDSSNVIVRFVCRQHARECLSNKSKLRYIEDFKTLRIIENLCPKYKSLYEQCVELKRANTINQVWSYNGTVCIKKSDSSTEKPKRILHTNDLYYHFPDYDIE